MFSIGVYGLVRRIRENSIRMTCLNLRDEIRPKLLSSVEKSEILLALTVNNRITKIDMQDVNLEDADRALLLEVVKFNQNIKSLSLKKTSGKTFFDMGFMCQVLSNSPSLRRLDISENTIDYQAFEYLFGFLETNTTLSSLDISYNKIGDITLSNLARLLNSNKSLRKVYIRCEAYLRCWNVETFIQIAQNLNHSCLEKLVLDNTSFNLKAAEAFGKALAQNTRLKFLQLSSCSLGNEEVVAIVQGLQTNHCLEVLDLNYNMISCEALKKISLFLTTNKVLRTLKIRGCRYISEGSSLSLAAALRANSGLRYLDISESDITPKGVCHIMEGVASNTILEYLNISESHMNSDSWLSLCDMLKRNSILRNISLISCTPPKVPQLKKICGSLYFNSSLITLSMSIRDRKLVKVMGRITGILTRNRENLIIREGSLVGKLLGLV